MTDVSVKVKILYVIWKEKNGFEVNLKKLKEALHYKDERQLRDDVPELIHEGLLEIRQAQGKEPKWQVTEAGLRRIRFLTHSFVAVGLLTAFGGALVGTGVLFYAVDLPLQPAGQVGVGIVVLMFGAYLWVTRRRFEIELLKVEGQQDDTEG